MMRLVSQHQLWLKCTPRQRRASACRWDLHSCTATGSTTGSTAATSGDAACQMFSAQLAKTYQSSSMLQQCGSLCSSGVFIPGMTAWCAYGVQAKQEDEVAKWPNCNSRWTDAEGGTSGVCRPVAGCTQCRLPSTAAHGPVTTAVDQRSTWQQHTVHLLHALLHETVWLHCCRWYRVV